MYSNPPMLCNTKKILMYFSSYIAQHKDSNILPEGYFEVVVVLEISNVSKLV